MKEKLDLDDYKSFNVFNNRFESLKIQKFISKKVDFINEIPIEIWKSILSFSNKEDLSYIRKVSHEFNSLYYEDQFWKSILENQLKIHPFIPQIDYEKIFHLQKKYDYHYIYKIIYHPIFHDKSIINKSLTEDMVSGELPKNFEFSNLTKYLKMGLYFDVKEHFKDLPLGTSKFGGTRNQFKFFFNNFYS